MKGPASFLARGAWLLVSVLLLAGCHAPAPGAYPTLKQTQIHIAWAMTDYRNAAIWGRLSLGERERVNAAYAAYQSAFNAALQAAGGNRNVPTPDNVKALANEVIRVVSAIPK